MSRDLISGGSQRGPEGFADSILERRDDRKLGRIDGRGAAELRPVTITRNYLKYAEGSVLIEVGDTRVICSASLEDRVPPFLKGSGQGWITAEYGMLPRSTHERSPREAARGHVAGRTQEIQRLIGRSLRSVVDLTKLGEVTIWIDCDVIQADGGTRTASITGSFIAIVDALKKLLGESSGGRNKLPISDFLAAVSVGVVDGEEVLDLKFEEDSRAWVDMNLIMTGRGRFVEIQGTAEKEPFTKEELDRLLELGKKGIGELIGLQKQVLGEDAGLIGGVSYPTAKAGGL